MELYKRGYLKLKTYLKHTRQAKSLTAIYERDHFVQYYLAEEALAENLGRFIGAGIIEGDACVVVATPSHRQALLGFLSSRGLNTAPAEGEGRFIVLDAAEILAKFMVNEALDKQLFYQTIRQILEAATVKGRRVRIFGEMVALLWAEGNEDVAITLESLWNDLAKEYSFTLFCAYPADYFKQKHQADLLEKVNHLHTITISPA